MYAQCSLKGLPTQLEHSGIEWFVTKKHEKAKRIANRLHGRKADVEYKRSKSRSLVKIYH